MQSELQEQVQPSSTQQKWNDLTLLGYVEINGVKSLSDETLVAIYEKLKLDGTLDVVFHDEKMKDGDQFIKFIKRHDNLFVFPILKGSIVGMAWINSIKDNHAFGNFVFFKEVWGHAEPIGEAIIEWWFNFKVNDKPVLDVIIGQTPEWNKKAIKFISKLGFTKLGIIPYIAKGKGMLISYKVR